jgi:hypothetical protein
VIEPPAEKQRFVFDVDGLPSQFPTQRHSGSFWEQLGRTVATFGFLEDMLGRSIFALTATTECEEDEGEAAFEKWFRKLERALTDPLGRLIDAYEKAIRSHPEAIFENLDQFLSQLRDASELRNVLCHGSWSSCPDAEGKSIPRYVNNNMMMFTTPVDIAYLKQTQRAVAELACHVVNSITSMGWQFPGSKGPGAVIYGKKDGG